MKVAHNDLLPAIEEAGPQAIILADGFSCRRQVSDLIGRRALTLSEVFASHVKQQLTLHPHVLSAIPN